MSNTSRLLAVALAAAAILGCGGPAQPPSPGATGTGSAGSSVVGRIGDYEITMDDLDRKARETDVSPYQALYDARKNALDALVSEHLMTTEAEARGVTMDVLVADEVTQKTSPPTAEEIQAFYDENKAAMRGRTLEQTSAQIRSFLANRSRQNAMNDLIKSLREKYGVTTSLEPPRVPVMIAENDPRKGPDGAAVRILAYSDFQ